MRSAPGPVEPNAGKAGEKETSTMRLTTITNVSVDGVM